METKHNNDGPMTRVNERWLANLIAQTSLLMKSDLLHGLVVVPFVEMRRDLFRLWWIHLPLQLYSKPDNDILVTNGQVP